MLFFGNFYSTAKIFISEFFFMLENIGFQIFQISSFRQKLINTCWAALMYSITSFCSDSKRRCGPLSAHEQSEWTTQKRSCHSCFFTSSWFNSFKTTGFNFGHSSSNRMVFACENKNYFKCIIIAILQQAALTAILERKSCQISSLNLNKIIWWKWNKEIVNNLTNPTISKDLAIKLNLMVVSLC